MPKGIATQVLGGFKTGMDRQSKRGGKDGAQRLYTLQNAYLNERGDAVPRPGLQHVADVSHSAGLYGWQGQLHVFHGETDFVDPGNPLVTGHWVRYPLTAPMDLAITGAFDSIVVGVAYSSDLAVTGSVKPYSNLRVLSGSLPAGLALSIADGDNLRLSGMPTSFDTANFTVAIDSADEVSATSAQSVSASGDVTDDFLVDSIASYTEYADTTAGWFVNTSDGGTMLQSGVAGEQSVLTRNGVAFADGHIAVVTSQASDSGLALRLADKNNYYVMVFKDAAHTNGNQIIVYKRVGGVFTSLGSGAIDFAQNTTHTFRFSAAGTSLVASFDGVPIVSVTDSSITAAGKCGMRSGSVNEGQNPFGSFTWPY